MDKRRVQLDFSVQALNELDQLKSDANFSTRAELIKQSLRLFYWIWKEQKTGRILVEDESGMRQIVFPYWGPLHEEKLTEEHERLKGKSKPAAFIGSKTVSAPTRFKERA